MYNQVHASQSVNDEKDTIPHIDNCDNQYPWEEYNTYRSHSIEKYGSRLGDLVNKSREELLQIVRIKDPDHRSDDFEKLTHVELLDLIDDYITDLRTISRNDLIQLLHQVRPKIYSLYCDSLSHISNDQLINLIKYSEPTPVGKDLVYETTEHHSTTQYHDTRRINRPKYHNMTRGELVALYRTKYKNVRLHDSLIETMEDELIIEKLCSHTVNYYQDDQRYSFQKVYFNIESGLAKTQTEVLFRRKYNMLRLNAVEYRLLSRLSPSQTSYYNPFIVKNYSLNSTERRKARHYKLIWEVFVNLYRNCSSIKSVIYDISTKYFERLLKMMMDDDIKYKPYMYKKMLLLYFISKYIELNSIIQLSFTDLISQLDFDVHQFKFNFNEIGLILKNHDLKLEKGKKQNAREILAQRIKYIENEYITLAHTNLRYIYPADHKIFNQFLKMHLNTRFSNQISKLVFRMGRMKTSYVDNINDIIQLSFFQQYMDISLRIFLELKYCDATNEDIRTKQKSIIEIISRSRKYENVEELIYSIYTSSQYTSVYNNMDTLLSLLVKLQTVDEWYATQETYQINKYLIIDDILHGIGKFSEVEHKLGDEMFSIFLYRYCRKYLSTSDYEKIVEDLASEIRINNSTNTLATVSEEIF